MPSECRWRRERASRRYYTDSSMRGKRGVSRVGWLVGRGSTYCAAVVCRLVDGGEMRGRKGWFHNPADFSASETASSLSFSLSRSLSFCLSVSLSLPSPFRIQCRCHRLRHRLYFDCTRRALETREISSRFQIDPVIFSYRKSPSTRRSLTIKLQ